MTRVNQRIYQVELMVSDLVELRAMLAESNIGSVIQDRSIGSAGDQTGSLKFEVPDPSTAATVMIAVSALPAVSSIIKKWIEGRRQRIKITNSKTGISFEYEGMPTKISSDLIDQVLSDNTSPSEVKLNSVVKPQEK